MQVANLELRNNLLITDPMLVLLLNHENSLRRRQTRIFEYQEGKIGVRSIPSSSDPPAMCHTWQWICVQVMRCAVHRNVAENFGATKNIRGWAEKSITRLLYIRRTMGTLRTNQSKWHIPRKRSVSLPDTSMSMRHNLLNLSTATRSTGLTESRGIFVSIAFSPPSSMQAFEFRSEIRLSLGRV